MQESRTRPAPSSKIIFENLRGRVWRGLERGRGLVLQSMNDFYSDEEDKRLTMRSWMGLIEQTSPRK